MYPKNRLFASWQEPASPAQFVARSFLCNTWLAITLIHSSRFVQTMVARCRRLERLQRGGGYRDNSNPDRPRHKTMTLAAEELMRRFLLHVLPAGFHRICHSGLLSKNGRKEKIALTRQLLNVVPAARTGEVAVADTTSDESTRPNFICAHCSAQMLVVESFLRGHAIRAPPDAQGES